MESEISKMVNEEYARTLQAVSAAQTGSEEAKWQLQKLSELHRQRMSELKASEEALYQSKELSIREEQTKDGKKDRIIKVALEGAAILVPVAVSSYWMAKGMKFEETGTFTSRTGRWVSEHLKLFKK